MKLVRPRTFVIFAMLSLLGVGLLQTSQNVRRAEKELAALKVSIDREEEKIRMLKAEWVHLNRPERLERLAEEFLELSAPKVDRIVSEGNEAEGAFIEAQPVSASPVRKAPKPPKKQVIKEKNSKDFGALLDELGSDTGGAQ